MTTEQTIEQLAEVLKNDTLLGSPYFVAFDGEELVVAVGSVADREKREDGWWIRYQRDIIHADGRVETEYQWQHKQEHDGGWRELKTNKRTIALFDVLIEAWAKGDEQREARVRLDKISRDLPDLSGGF